MARTSYYRCLDDLSLEPLAKDIEGYRFSKAKADFFAALSVALLSVPQALAYSIVVGVPPVAGIISMVIGTMIAALLSSSSHLVIGPNNATALLVQAASIEVIRAVNPESSLSSIEVLTYLSLLIGTVQLLAAIFKLGRLIQFVSYSVVIGYIAGTAFAIGVGQLFPLTGMVCPGEVDTLYQKLVYWLMHVHEGHMLTSIVGGSSLFLCLFMRRRRWKVPIALVMIIFVTSSVIFFGLDKIVDAEGRALQLLSCGDLQLSAISFDPPFFDFRLLNFIVPTAFAIALIGMLEANAIAKNVAATTGQRINGNQEIFALGCANFFLSFFGGIPSSGSASRTSMNLEHGAMTRMAAIFASGLVALFTLGLGSFFQYIPTAALAALLVTTALRLVDIRQVLLCWSTTRSDAFVLSATFFSCVFFTLPLALYIGVGLSIILYLRKAAIPHVCEYIYEESIRKFRPASEEERKGNRAIRVINVEGELFFGAMDLFQYALRAMAKDDRTTRVIIVRLKHVHDLDVTAILALKQLKDYLDRHEQSLIVCSVPSYVMKLLQSSKLVSYLGEENIVSYDPRSIHGDLQKAFARAREILQKSGEAVAYEIGSVPVIQQNFVTINVPAIKEESSERK